MADYSFFFFLVERGGLDEMSVSNRKILDLSVEE